MAEECSVKETPLDSDIPGGWLETPASENTDTQSNYLGRPSPNGRQPGQAEHIPLDGPPSTDTANGHDGAASTIGAGIASTAAAQYIMNSGREGSMPNSDAEPSNSREPVSEGSKEVPSSPEPLHPTEEVEVQTPIAGDSPTDEDGKGYAPVKSERSQRPPLEQRPSQRKETEEDLREYLSRRNTTRSGQGLSREVTQASSAEEQQEIDRLMSRMFGTTRQAHSEEEKTRHRGVVFKHLTVKGMGLGAALQPTFGDVFLGLPRLLKNLFSKGPKKTAGKPPIKTILDNFSGVIKPGEMCLVLGKPGSGCSTFLKIIGNQRFGYESIEGDVVYGGVDAKHMLQKFRGEIVYNPEDDLHYATLSVRRTLEFALKTKTPSAESRNEGETPKEYVQNFLKSVVKLFWIEHTLDTKVGNEYVRGVSGGEKKRVSIAEAMITKASIQAWDNSTRGLDASTALEYVSSLRSLTNMANISTAVALYQAGESLYALFDKVLLIDGGRCAYFGHAEDAAKYFKDLGFVQPDRWTTADFLTSVTDKHERHVKEGWEDRIPRSADDFGDIFAKSQQHQNNLAEIEEFEHEMDAQIEARKALQGKATQRKNYTIPFYKQVRYSQTSILTCFRRLLILNSLTRRFLPARIVNGW